MGRFTNFFNETPEEQERRRQTLYQQYDNLVGASQPKKDNIFQKPWNVASQAFNTAARLNTDSSINNDKYKHAYISCEGAQQGPLGALTVGAMGVGKEIADVVKKSGNLMLGRGNYHSFGEIFNDSKGDWQADKLGIQQGYKYPYDDCDQLISKYYSRYR